MKEPFSDGGSARYKSREEGSQTGYKHERNESRAETPLENTSYAQEKLPFMLSRSGVTVRTYNQELLARSPIALRNFLFEYPCTDHEEADPCQYLRGSPSSGEGKRISTRKSTEFCYVSHFMPFESFWNV